jgi:hypothetical protein
MPSIAAPPVHSKTGGFGEECVILDRCGRRKSAATRASLRNAIAVCNTASATDDVVHRGKQPGIDEPLNATASLHLRE